MDDRQGYVPGLDGIRAGCITLVVLGHLGFGDLIPAGLGVTAFFFLSGYLITGLLAAEHERFGRVDLPRFYGRRMLRLLPELAVLVAVLGLVLAPVMGRPLPLLQAFANLTYWTNYYTLAGLDSCDHCAVTGHLWSLAVEEHFYLLMPLAMAACVFLPGRLSALLTSVLVACLGWRIYAHGVLGMPELYTYQATECRVDSIGWGCLAAVVQRARPDVAEFVRRRGGAVFAVGLVLLLASLAIRGEAFRATARYSLQGLALAALIPAMVLSPRLAWLNRLLELAPLRWMGRRAYGAYLWHYLALTAAGMALGVAGPLEGAALPVRLVSVPLVLAGTWILAALSYRLVFEPCQALKPWLTPRPATPAPSVRSPAAA